jgi:hypothetical protein
MGVTAPGSYRGRLVLDCLGHLASRSLLPPGVLIWRCVLRTGVVAWPARPSRAGQDASAMDQDSFPVLRTFCSSVLALFTVAVKFAPCISAFIMFGIIWSVASAVPQFLLLSGEIWV